MVCPPVVAYPPVVRRPVTCPIASSKTLSQTVARRRGVATYFHRPSKWWAALWLPLVISVLPVMAGPYHRERPRWVNPCFEPGHVFDPNDDLQGAPMDIEPREIYTSIMRGAKSAEEHAMPVIDRFEKSIQSSSNQISAEEYTRNVNETFKDRDFVPGMAVHRLNWLPKIPSATEEYFRNLRREDAFRKSFEYLQYFAVGIEQIVLDQVIHEGKFAEPFKEVEEQLTQVLCELQVGLYGLKITTSPDIMRDVMRQEYRDISARSRRNLRDYLILRDYIKATHFVSELFAFLLRT